jgi:hypothetical protein
MKAHHDPEMVSLAELFGAAAEPAQCESAAIPSERGLARDAFVHQIS